jgi:lipid-A-disaccharide synthase
MSCDLFIFAGEKSGDLHGEKLLESLKALDPSLRIAGVGGPRMRAQGMLCVLPMEEFQVMGFIDVFFALPKLMRQFYLIARTILQFKPKAVLFIDYPGFNLRMARHLRKKGYQGKLCHFICPSVWAWGKKRIPLMAKHLDLLLTILPFEKEYFSSTTLDVAFVGHPLIQRFKEHSYKPLTVPKERKTIAIFPGSRKKELLRNFPLYLKVCAQLKKTHSDLFFAISVSDEKYRPLIESMIAEQGLNIGSDLALFPVDATHDLMKSAHAAIAKSGTVTLELALHAVPTVVTYAISKLDLIIARDILRIRLPHYCLVNIIAKDTVFPELFGPNFTKESLLTHCEKMIGDENTRSLCRNQCRALKESLKDKNASLEAANLVLSEITQK